MANRKLFRVVLVATGVALLASGPETFAAKLPLVGKWERFELTLKSGRAYTNALQEAEVRALFVSPLGETNRVYGFWDGGRTWRVRFAPDFPGRWTYRTLCSDTANAGLHEQTGELMCGAATGRSRFGEHGPVQVARDHKHLEHADHTPFLWLGDAAWDAACGSSLSNWMEYAKTRAEQKFNTVQWRLAPGGDDQPSGPYTGRGRIAINPDYFKRLDVRVDALNRAGLLNAIAPLWEIGVNAEDALPEDQAVALLRYAVGRWGGNAVAWIVALESDNTGAQAERWKRIGRAVFAPIAHAPVIVLPGDAHWVLNDFRSEPWVDALGFQTAHVMDEDALPWLLQGPLSLERGKVPGRPLITIEPPVEAVSDAGSGRRVSADFVRRALWWSLLVNTPAGVSCSAEDVARWTGHPLKEGEAPWRQALALPGAAAIAPLGDFFSAKEFWRLEPFRRPVTVEADVVSPGKRVVATVTETGDMALLYVGEDRAVTVLPRSWPATASTTWFDPRTGESRRAVAVASPTGLRYATPSEGDWLLVVNAGK
jgi:hypothetical protein